MMHKEVLLAVALSLVPLAGAAVEPMKLVYYDTYYPFSWKNEAGEMQGLLIDIMDEALRGRAGLRVEHRGYPWKRAQSLVRRGEADAFVTGATPERRKYTEISAAPAIVTRDVLFTWAGNPDMDRLRAVRTVADLAPFKIVTYIGNGWAEENLQGLNVRWVAEQRDVLTMLDRRRDDVTIESALITHAVVRQMGLAGRIVEVPGPVIAEYAYNLCIRKGSRYVEVLPEFDRIVRQMRRDGTIEAIRMRYR